MTIIYSPVAIIATLIGALCAAVLFGQKHGGSVKLSGRAALWSAATIAGVYCVGTALLVLIKD